MLNTITSFSGERAHEPGVFRQIEAGYTVFSQQATLMPHAHESQYELLFVQNGQGRIGLDERTFIANEGDLVIYRPGAMHMEDWRGTQNLPLVFYCKLDIASGSPSEQALADLASRYPVLSAGEYAQQISRLMWALDLEQRAQGPCSGEIIQCLVSNLLVLARRLLLKLEPERDPGAPQTIAQQARRYIEAHYAERLTLEVLASALHVSVYHLAHEFKRELGESPIRYLNALRMEKARLLLITTLYPVQEIVFRVGFESVPNFNQLFKRQSGMTPSQYRRRNAASATDNLKEV